MEAVWINGPIARVVMAKGTVWCVQLQNSNGDVLAVDDGQRFPQQEVSYPYPGNKSKTSSIAKFLGKHHKVPVYLRDPARGHTLIQGVK